ncbi:MAG: aquaporin family protein [Candidatus Obscuribacterales bacterium]|nr:aquaporin family protein [Candidatus Obscuribacterales bacterium]
MNLSRALVCEFLGSAFLLAAVVGSGALAHKLDAGNIAVSVLSVSFATMGTLSALIFALGSISAHFNPIVTFALACRKEFEWKDLLPYWFSQITGAIFGVLLTNLMFDLPAICISETVRSGAGQWLAEVIASFGLLGIIFGTARSSPQFLPLSVPFYVAGAIFFTSSTCFANPAVTIARIFTSTLCGIAPSGVLPFIFFQFLGALLAIGLFGWLYKIPQHPDLGFENRDISEDEKRKFEERLLSLQR